MGDSYYVCVYKIENLKNFIEDNPKYIFNEISCSGYVGIGASFFPDDKYNLVIKKENEVFCIHSKNGRNSWIGVLNKKMSMIYIEIGFPDFSGDLKKYFQKPLDGNPTAFEKIYFFLHFNNQALVCRYFSITNIIVNLFQTT